MKNLFYLSVLFTLIFSGCKKKTDPIPELPPAYYMYFDDGVSSIKMEHKVNNIYNEYFGYSGNNYFIAGGEFAANGAPDFQASGYICFGENYGISPNRTMLYNSFSTGANVFGNESALTTGFILRYTDSNYTFWASDSSSADQTGSSINIQSISPYSPSNDFYVVKGTFNCRVYDSMGNSRQLTNGRFKSMFAYHQ